MIDRKGWEWNIEEKRKGGTRGTEEKSWVIKLLKRQTFLTYQISKYQSLANILCW